VVNAVVVLTTDCTDCTDFEGKVTTIALLETGGSDPTLRCPLAFVFLCFCVFVYRKSAALLGLGFASHKNTKKVS
jgi:hypothetical protein